MPPRLYAESTLCRFKMYKVGILIIMTWRLTKAISIMSHLDAMNWNGCRCVLSEWPSVDCRDRHGVVGVSTYKKDLIVD